MFIQSAFIRKNSPYLQEKLKEMGYKTNSISVNTGCIATSSANGSFVVIDESRFDSINPHVTWNNGNRIDCGINEDLFLSIAALRDDADKNQYWICDRVSVTIGKTYYPGDYIYYKYDEFFDKQNWHKATVEEIIEHFKKE